MILPDELDATQGAPEGETVTNPGDETPAPEQEVEASEEQLAEPDTEETPEPEKPEPEKPVEKKKISWELRRINEETNKRREAERRAAELDAEIKRLRGVDKPAATTEEAAPVDAEQIRARARDEIRQEEAVRLATERFNEACNKTFEQGVAAYGQDFETAANTLSQALGDDMQKRPEFLQVITDLENGHQVYYELSRNPEEAERLLKMPSHKMILELGRMSEKAGKPTPKPISKAPAPVTPVGGQPKPRQELSDDMPMDEFADKLLRKLASAN